MTPTWPIKQFYWEIVDIWGLIFIMTNDKCNSGSTSSEQEAMMHWNLFINRSSGQVQTGQVHPSSYGASSNYKLLVGPEQGIKCICEAKLCQNIWERQKKVKSASCSWAKGLKQSPHSLLYCNFTRGPALQCKMGSLGPQPWSSDKRARCWSKPSFGNAPKLQTQEAEMVRGGSMARVSTSYVPAIPLPTPS